jgi:MSHA biogenesis protein MshL
MKLQRYSRALSYAGIGLILSACASQGVELSEPRSHIDEAIANNQKVNTPHNVPENISDALLGNTGSGANTEAQVERFDISVHSVPARAFFLGLVADAGVNVVAHPEIEGLISLELNDVSVEEVLDVVRDVYGYEYRYRNGIYSIYPRKLRTEIFPINYLDVQRVGVTDTSVLIGNINSSNSGGSRGGGSSGGNQGGSGSADQSANLLGYLDSTGEGDGEGISPGSRVQTLSKTDFWNNLNKTLIGIIGGETDGRMVMANAQSGMVVVRALPRELNVIREFLEKSELSVKRQVVLETKILEVQLNDNYESGINWGAISGELTLQNTILGEDSLSEVLFGQSGTAETFFSSVLQVTDLSKLVSLLDRQGNVQVLSSPRISTVNNQKALIRVGSDEFFVTGISNSTTANAAAVTSTPDIELGSFFSGISLDVTPQIADNGEVILHVHPIVSTVQDQLKEIQVGDDNFSLPLALRDVRESDSIVRAASGQVVVLGGLMQESSSGVDTKRGFLGNIPVVNVLFKHKKKVSVKTELVILMRPIVVDNDGWQEELRRGAERMGLISDEMEARGGN